MSGHGRGGRRWVWRAVLVALVAGLLTLPTGSATTVATTDNGPNRAAAPLRLLPPTQVQAVVSRQDLLSLSCRAVVSWTASASATPIAYEVRRVDRTTGAVIAGPWTVTQSPFTDGPIALAILVPSDWQVRTVRSGDFASEWVTSATTYQGICVL